MILNNFSSTTYDITLGISSFFFVWIFIILGILILSGWMIFEKAGIAGWKSLIPFYNSYCYVKISGRNGWWFLLLFIPVISAVFKFFLAIDIGKAFGKSMLYSIFFIWLFPIVGLLFIGWDKRTVYLDPKYNG